MKICILSDSHDNRAPLKQAVQEARDWGAECIIHCGDVISAYTLRTVVHLGVPIHSIHGNNVGDIPVLVEMSKDPANQVSYYGMDATLELGGRRIFVVHYPHYAEGMVLTGDYDLVCCGHDHVLNLQQVSNIKGGKSWLVNPGSVAGLGGPASYVRADLATMEFEPRIMEM